MTSAWVVLLSTSHRCCGLTQRASVSMRKCADWVNLKFVYGLNENKKKHNQTTTILPFKCQIIWVFHWTDIFKFVASLYDLFVKGTRAPNWQQLRFYIYFLSFFFFLKQKLNRFDQDVFISHYGLDGMPDLSNVSNEDRFFMNVSIISKMFHLSFT